MREIDSIISANADVDPPVMDRRKFAALGVGLATAGVLTIAACTTSSDKAKTPGPEPEASTSTTNREINQDDDILQAIATSLINLKEQDGKGWKFRSQIQRPHYQTDRDVGASSVGMGFLAMADIEPANPTWLGAAKHTADWLLDVASKDKSGGLYWPDYIDDEPSEDVYTSFDDGTIGVGDYLWRLYEATSDPRYKHASLAALRWTFSKAEYVDGSANVLRWRWNVNGDEPEYYMGMGQGSVGLIHSFATFYERLKDTDPSVAEQCKVHIDGSLRYMDKVRARLGKNDGDARAVPETAVIGFDGDTNMNSGYLSGAAGAAFTYLKLYQVFKDPSYLKEADRLFGWLEDTNDGPMVQVSDDAVAWKLAIDPQGGDSRVLATGFEEGSAGIGWTYLQAYQVTGNGKYLAMAKKAANWLEDIAVREHGGITWHEGESPTNPIIHTNLNNGAAGIAWFLEDLSRVSGDKRYHTLAAKAQQWILATAKKDQQGNIYWDDNDGEDDYSKDPSWHWGTAGIIGFLGKMSGGGLDIPGEQSGLRAKR